MPIKTSSAKGKGRALQKHVCKILTEVFGWEEGDAESRSSGAAGVDVMMSGRARKEFPISLECKNVKTFPSLSALKQSQENKYKNTIAGVVWKPFGKSYDDSIIYFNLKDFAEFWKRSIDE